MCGRARCTLRANDISRAAHISDGLSRSVNMDRYQPSYNAAPGFNFPVIRREDTSDGRRCDVIHCMKWGLVPSFTKATEKPDHYKMFNARSETVSEKASFRRLIPHNRCIVAVEGFYEWKKDGTKKQPYFIHLKDGRSLVFAALYDSWKNTEGEILHTFTILTTSSASALQWLHDRMPVILGDKESIDAWLSGSLTKYDTLLKPYENSDLVWYPVTPEMGKPSFNGPECIKEVQLKSESKNQILNFFSKKEPGSDQDSKPKGTFTVSEVPKKSLPKSVKEEPETEVQARTPYHTDVDTKGSKPSVSELPQEGDKKSQMKREHEEFKIDSRPANEETNKLCTNPIAKKKKMNGNQKNDDPKQLKLGSFFRKS